jgi:putative transposase
LIFVAKYRRGLLRPEHLDLVDALRKVCSDFGATLVECDGDDHVHLLVDTRPRRPSPAS